MSALILDTETTGLDAPEVVQLARMGPLDTLDAAAHVAPIEVTLFRPSKPISLGAMATHHILDEELVNAEPWLGTWTPPTGTEYLVGHNVDFDWKAIGQPHVARICTLALARWLWPDIDSHRLSALIYFLFKHADDREMVQQAHHAGQDVWLCSIVLRHILAARPECTTWHQVWQMSERARVPMRMPFGKYGPKDGKPGRLIEELRRNDADYVNWCLRQPDFDPYLVKALKGIAA